MAKPLRVLHVPGRTPYARKLLPEGAVIVNQTRIGSRAVPRDATFAWIEAQDAMDFFDVLHVQSLEFASVESIRCVLERCGREKKGIVAAIHETEPLFPERGTDFPARVRLISELASCIVTLTTSARRDIMERYGIPESKLRVVPHGPVLPLSHPLWRAQPGRNSRCTIGMFGGFRPNRSFLAGAVNALYGLSSAEILVRLLTRGLNPVELAPGSEVWQFASLAATDPRLVLELLPFPSDDEIASFVHSLDILLLPYLYGTHSGQLELAMDLGVPVVIPDIGCYRAQWELHSSLVPEPHWFTYSPGDPYSFGGPFLEALRDAHARWSRGQPPAFDRAAFHAVREREQGTLLEAHRVIYSQAVPG